MEPVYQYRAIAERVIDGDTYQLRVDLGFHVAISIPGRLHGVNTPEMNTEAGKQAQKYVQDLLLPESGPVPLIVKSYKDRQSFARWVVDVYVSGESLADHLISRKIGEVMER